MLGKVGLLGHVVTHLSERSPEGDTVSVPVSATSLSQDRVRCILDARMSELLMSAGQMQSLCLARALLQDNKTVVLDEVTSAIDVVTEERVRSVLTAELRGKAVIMEAHREGKMGVCDIVVELHEAPFCYALNDCFWQYQNEWVRGFINPTLPRLNIRPRSHSPDTYYQR